MKLIGSLTSPYVRKVRIMMAEKKLDYQWLLEDVWGNDAILAEVGQAAQLAPSECSAAQVRAIYRKMQWRLRAGDLHLNTRH